MQSRTFKNLGESADRILKLDVSNNEKNNFWPGGEVPKCCILRFVYARILVQTENIGLETSGVYLLSTNSFWIYQKKWINKQERRNKPTNMKYTESICHMMINVDINFQ